MRVNICSPPCRKGHQRPKVEKRLPSSQLGAWEVPNAPGTEAVARVKKICNYCSLQSVRTRDSLNSIAFLAHQAIGSPEADKCGGCGIPRNVSPAASNTTGEGQKPSPVIAARLVMQARARGPYGTVMVVPSPLAVTE